MTDSSAEPLHLLIAGGGVAGLEALIAVRSLAGDRVRVTLLDPADDFVYQPMSVAEPFARRGAETTSLDEVAREFSAERVKDLLDRVDPATHEVATAGGSTIGYDVLLLTLGAHRRAALPHATTFRGAEDAESVHGLIQDIEGGYIKSVAFVVPGGVTWPLPLYELALMAAGRAREMGQDLDVTVVTPEDTPLAAFGQQASAAVAELMRDAGIALETSAYADVEGRRLHLRPAGRDLEPDRIVALPVLEGPAPRGLPADERGFIPTGAHGRVAGVDDVYAAGDGTQFPIKQGGVATQQADIAVADIVARVGVEVPTQETFRPVLRAKLLAGRDERYLRGDEATGGRGSASEISTQPLWWPPSKIAGAYLAPYLAGPDAAAAPDREGLEIELPLS